MIKIFHQLGHRYKWSMDSLVESNTGDGVIIGPRYMDYEKVAALPTGLRESSFF